MAGVVAGEVWTVCAGVSVALGRIPVPTGTSVFVVTLPLGEAGLVVVRGVPVPVAVPGPYDASGTNVPLTQAPVVPSTTSWPPVAVVGAAVGDAVGESVPVSVGESVPVSVGDPVGDSVSVAALVGDSVGDSVPASVVGEAVSWASVVTWAGVVTGVHSPVPPMVWVASTVTVASAACQLGKGREKAYQLGRSL